MKKQVEYLYRFIFTASILISTFSISCAQKSTKTSTLASTGISDSAFIIKNIIDNIMEIQLNEMAEMKSNDAKLKNLAQQMVSDHTQLLNDFQNLAKKRNMTFSTMDSVIGTTNSKMATTGSGSTGSSAGTAGSGATSSGIKSSVTSTSASASAVTDSTAVSNVNVSRTEKSKAANGDSVPVARGIEATNGSPIGNRKGATDSASGIKGNSTADSIAEASATRQSPAGFISGTTNPGAVDHATIDTLALSDISRHDVAAVDSLRSASGTQFNTLFVSQMLAMHEAKLAELQTAAIKLTDPELKQAVIKAIPRVRMHRDMLAKMNKAVSNTSSSQP